MNIKFDPSLRATALIAAYKRNQGDSPTGNEIWFINQLNDNVRSGRYTEAMAQQVLQEVHRQLGNPIV